LNSKLRLTSDDFTVILTSQCSDSVAFSIQNGCSVSLIDKSYLNGNVGEFFGFVKGGKLLSEKNEKAHSITLRLYAYPDLQPVDIVCCSLFVSCCG